MHQEQTCETSEVKKLLEKMMKEKKKPMLTYQQQKVTIQKDRVLTYRTMIKD